MGLGIMRFRAAVIGARLVIERGKAGGTHLVCTCAQGTADN
jgi:nitrate/nitrite-specific signal transduction histidine kinase